MGESSYQFWMGLPLKVDLDGLKKVVAAVRGRHPAVRIEVRRVDGWKYEAESLDDALDESRFGTYWLESIVLQISETSSIRIENKKDRTFSADLPGDEELLFDEVAKLVRSYRSPFTYFVGMPWWAAVNLFLVAPWFLGRLVGALMSSPKQLYATEIAGPGPTGILRDLGTSAVTLVVSLSIIAGILWPLRRLYDACFPNVEFAIPPNKDQNVRARWGRNLAFGIPIAIFVAMVTRG